MDNLEPSHDDESKSDRLAWVVWGVVIALGVAAYELFHQPAMLGASISLKFAWGDAHTAWWLRKRDPNRRRGMANFCVYLGYGLWKAAICGFLLTLVFATLEGLINGKPVNQPKGQRDDTLVQVFAGSCSGSFFTGLLSGVICSVGFVLAVLAKSKLWLNSRVAACRVRDRWPPEGGEKNVLVRVAIPSGLMTSSLIAGGIAFAVASLIQGDRQQTAAFVIIFAVMVVIPAFVLYQSDWVKSRLAAVAPEEAWPEEEIEHLKFSEGFR